MKKPNIKRTIAVISLLIATGVFVFFAARAIIGGPQGTVAVVIPEGSSVNDISTALQEKDVISNTWIFKFYVFSSGKTEKLLPGRYILKKNDSYRRVIDALVGGPKKPFYNLTIPEGFTLKQIGARFSKQGGVDKKEFSVLAYDPDLYKYEFLNNNKIKDLEGYLFPETYRLDAETQTAEVLNMMLTQFENEYKAFKDRKMPIKLNTHEIVTLASLVEREAKLKEEQPIIAGVIYNRLRKKMRLEIDATIQYALGKQKKKLTLKDLKVDSPYNTYKYAGLPPSPIGSPGRSALQAALKPANVKYLYYVLVNEKSGKHFFTDSYQEFLKAKKSAE